MTITFPLSHPSVPDFKEIRWTTSSSVAVSRSPFTYTEEVQVFAGQNFMIDVALPPMNRDEAEEWIAFQLKLNGREGTFLLGDPVSAAPRGSAPGAPAVDGAHAGGSRVLATKGWTPSQSGVLLPGDFIHVVTASATRLHKNLNTVNSDGSGNATLNIFPAVRAEGFVNSATIVTANCKNTWRMRSNQSAWDVYEAQQFGISFQASGVV